MVIELDRAATTPLYVQISQQLKTQIRTGELAAGVRLPPERRLAAMLGVNRTTIVNAYRELAADGLVAGHVGRGTVVIGTENGNRFSPPSTVEMPWEQLFTSTTEVMNTPLLRDTRIVSARTDVISLATGIPSPELYPIDTIRGLLNSALNDAGQSLLQYCPLEGYQPLRDALAARMPHEHRQVDPAEILVAAGSQQGLFLLASTVIEPGDLVAIESPTYLGALQVFRAAGARLLSIPVDENGMRVELLEDLISRRRPKLIYTLPTFQNPTGATMSFDRRQRLLALASRYQVPIIEDDPYGALRYEGRSMPSLHTLDRHGTVIYLSTVSKMLFPGFRIGWIAAPRPVIERLALMKQIVDLDTNPLAQWAVWAFLERGLIDPHLERLRQIYPAKRDRMIGALERAVGDAMDWSRPAGGFYLWCRLHDGLRSRDLLAEAARQGVAIAPGESFYPDGEGESTLRLNFTLPSEDEIDEGVARLARAIEALRASRVGGVDRQHASVTPIV
jgi:2-aminoadipate transaminase